MSQPPFASVLPLCQLSAGGLGRIRRLTGTPEFCQRVREMGLGESMFVTKISGTATILCQVNGNRIALSHDAAKAIEVEPLTSRPPQLSMATLTPLSALKVGTSAVVREFPKTGAAFVRLREMGLLAGTRVTLLRLAPLGDPLEIKVRGYNLSLRKSEADHVLVEPAV
jgi:ferrous iron transport protein A